MIEPVTEKNLAEVLPLIRMYQEFYNISDISDKRNQEFFAQFGPDSSAGCQFVFRGSEKILAFATVYFSYTSSIASKTAVLNDLFTLPEARRKGIGRTLIEHSWKYVSSKGAVRLHWATQVDNTVAQSLYRSLGAKESTWKIYVYST
jgi:ribosomal protein S18 acetylase RimI-like enzyme